jgi:hypothetical protein
MITLQRSVNYRINVDVAALLSTLLKHYLTSKLNVTTSEVKAFFRNQQGTKKGTEI